MALLKEKILIRFQLALILIFCCDLRQVRSASFLRKGFWMQIAFFRHKGIFSYVECAEKARSIEKGALFRVLLFVAVCAKSVKIQPQISSKIQTHLSSHIYQIGSTKGHIEDKSNNTNKGTNIIGTTVVPSICLPIYLLHSKSTKTPCTKGLIRLF